MTDYTMKEAIEAIAGDDEIISVVVGPGSYELARNYSHPGEFENESYIDEIEYRNKKKASTYYKLAFENAKTPKFKALCLRMMDYAEKNTFSSSTRVTEQFPQFSTDLSGCENLANYFKSRR